jgi:DNA processing protein
MPPPKISNITLIQRNDPGYLARPLDLYDRPNSLYIYGDIQLLNLPMFAIARRELLISELAQGLGPFSA